MNFDHTNTGLFPFSANCLTTSSTVVLIVRITSSKASRTASSAYVAMVEVMLVTVFALFAFRRVELTIEGLTAV